MASKDYRYTIGYTYYDEPDLLQEQLALWEKYNSQIEIVLVDDCSPKYPALDIVKDYRGLPDLKLYRVDKDLGFNSHGCRNLIAHVANSNFILFSDIDCQWSPETTHFLKTVTFKPKSLYKFCMYVLPGYKWLPFPGHPNVFLVDKESFWEAGGYDESFTGFHYGDKEFVTRLHAITDERQITASLSFMLVRGGRTTIVNKDIDKIQYDNEKMTMQVPIKEKKYKDMAGTVTTKINFPYTQVL